MIRTLHGPPHSLSELGDFYCVTFVNNGATLASISNIQNEQYKEEMGDDYGEKDWENVQFEEQTKAWVIFGNGLEETYGVLAIFYKIHCFRQIILQLHEYLICTLFGCYKLF